MNGLSGLLGGHVSALALKSNDARRMKWYNRQLLDQAVDLGNRLLPAFNTSTGLPHPIINLKTGKPSLVSSHIFVTHVNFLEPCPSRKDGFSSENLNWIRIGYKFMEFLEKKDFGASWELTSDL